MRSHTVRFSVTAWDETPGLPDDVPRTGCISRGDVLDIGRQVRARERTATDLLAAAKDPASPDPIAGYACLYSGYGYQDRAAPGQPPWSRLHGFGPAFFTKFLYFSTPGALILDNRLANAVHRLSQQLIAFT